MQRIPAAVQIRNQARMKISPEACRIDPGRRFISTPHLVVMNQWLFKAQYVATCTWNNAHPAY